MADWNKIKTEYLTTDTSYRKLAQKYGVNATTIAKKASKEDWVSQRNQQASRTLSKTLTAVSNREVDRATRLQRVADRLLAKVERLIDEDDKLMEESEGENMLLGPKGMKSLAGVLKDIKEVQMIRSEADLREQEARIAKLRREAEREEDDHNKTVVVTIAGGDNSWQK